MPLFAISPLLQLYLVVASILVLKMVATGYLTAILRNVRRVYATPEDYAFLGRQQGSRDEQIERIRRAHRNDLESILPFLIVAFLASLTGAASYNVTLWLFVPFTVARFIHTITYSLGIQPWRSVAFAVSDIALVVTTLLLLHKTIYGT